MALLLRTAGNLYDIYADLRNRMPVVWSASDSAFLVSRYADVDACLRDPAFSSVVTPRSFDGSLNSTGPYLGVLHRQLDLMDAPTHTTIRRIYARVFEGGHVSRLREYTGDWLEERLDALPRRFDLISEIARPLARDIVLKLLGIGSARVDAFEHSVSTFIGGIHGPQPNAPRAHEAIAGLRRLVESALQDGDVDAQTVIGAARDATNLLSTEDVVANTILFYAAGLQTTTHLIGTGAWMVLTDATALADLRANSRLWPSAIEEIARLESPVQFVRRVATQSVEIAGCRIVEGDEVVLLLGAANRDPELFPDADRFDVGRAPNRHLAFGGGPHACLGALLARTQTRVALESVCAVSGLGLTDRTPSWMSSIAYRGLAMLHVDRS